jgi:hypothetical protein
MGNTETGNSSPRDGGSARLVGGDGVGLLGLIAACLV